LPSSSSTTYEEEDVGTEERELQKLVLMGERVSRSSRARVGEGGGEEGLELVKRQKVEREGVRTMSQREEKTRAKCCRSKLASYSLVVVNLQRPRRKLLLVPKQAEETREIFLKKG